MSFKLAIFSKTPMAASPWELFKALRKYTDVEAHLINGTWRYPDGRTFPYDYLLDGTNGAGRSWLAQADIWHVHNYLTPPLSELRANKRVMAQFHSLPRLGNWKALWDFANTRYTIRQPLQEKEYKIPALPNIIDPDEYRPVARPGKIAIGYAPSSRAPVGLLCSKGYDQVKRILSAVAAKRDVNVVVIEGMGYEANLEIKSRCHILIDDIVTGNWHRTSLEGACFGCAVINANLTAPFVYATLKTLEEKLLWLIDNPGTLADIQEQSRLWALEDWHAMDGVREYVCAYRELLR